MKTLYKFFKTAEVSQQITIHQKVKVEKYNLAKKLKKGYLFFDISSRFKDIMHLILVIINVDF
jgi:hypothetical protein